MFSMSKKAISRLFLAGLGVVVVGAVVVSAAIISALAGGLIEVGGPTVVSVNGGVAWTLAGPVLIGSLAIGAGLVAAILSWVAALLNTVRLDDKTWFVALLALGLFSWGWLAMVAYILAGPDGTDPDANRRATGTEATV